MNESIFRSFTRSFFVRFGSLMGILLGIFFGFMLIGIFLEKTDGENGIEYAYTPQIEANAQNERELLDRTTPVILKVNLQGIIGSEILNRHTMRQLLVESREKSLKNDRVKGILLNIDSPGGTVTDAAGIYDLLKAYKEQYHVPVYAYVDGLCASGGMYIACAADKIFTSESSIIGSIGVMAPTVMNFSKAMDKIGIDSLTMTAGKGKDDLNPFRPWKPDESENYQLMIDDFYEIFVAVVTENRPNVNREKLITEYGAKIFPPLKAKEIGFVDETGYSWNYALDLLAKDIGLEEGKYQVVTLKNDNWLLSIFKGQKDLSLLKGEIKHQLDIQGQLDPKLMNQYLYLYRE